ncbi:NAD-dependent epimerase/dehydratase family protein [Nitrospira lenta]|uniref:CDP-tyvelose epimerase n=1 Tax=Nitrospira lenta TaxID=1436998 RepID=A0A330L960_9BACT|nr:NAD-dependent epimerase/dehydratase family protein [Nitrospira lenta]SPP65631.1 CDP-tyvelose epimerase [Nitrospira lenta]
MAVAIVTGSAGLVGSETARFLARQGFEVVGIDNDMRKVLFGEDASTQWNRERLCAELPLYKHHDIDVRDAAAIGKLFGVYGSAIQFVLHAAAQPSHDWAARDPQADFGINANGTLNLLEAARRHCPDATFIFTSTNKVYGDTPNYLPLRELSTRWEIASGHQFEPGIDESMSIDNSTHSLFGVSKAAADLMVQEYGRYFGMKTACFRGGCLTGPNHSGTQLHGFLAYLMKCAHEGRPYTVFGYKGKQVRDNIHSADLVDMFWQFHLGGRTSEVYNAGGGRFSNCSMLEAIDMCEHIVGRPLQYNISTENRIGDHIWWVSNTEKFAKHFPSWKQRYDIRTTLVEIYDGLRERRVG